MEPVWLRKSRIMGPKVFKTAEEKQKWWSDVRMLPSHVCRVSGRDVQILFEKDERDETLSESHPQSAEQVCFGQTYVDVRNDVKVNGMTCLCLKDTGLLDMERDEGIVLGAAAEAFVFLMTMVRCGIPIEDYISVAAKCESVFGIRMRPNQVDIYEGDDCEVVNENLMRYVPHHAKRSRSELDRLLDVMFPEKNVPEKQELEKETPDKKQEMHGKKAKAKTTKPDSQASADSSGTGTSEGKGRKLNKDLLPDPERDQIVLGISKNFKAVVYKSRIPSLESDRLLEICVEMMDRYLAIVDSRTKPKESGKKKAGGKEDSKIFFIDDLNELKKAPITKLYEHCLKNDGMVAVDTGVGIKDKVIGIDLTAAVIQHVCEQIFERLHTECEYPPISIIIHKCG